jgi:mannosyltransferase OCH1-like enzyme
LIESSIIPQQIFTGISSLGLINADLSNNYENLRRNNPGWSHEIFTNEMQECFIKDNFDKEVFNAYLSIDQRYGSARNDLFKYCLIYLKGGIWLDAKSTCEKPFSKIIIPTDRFLLSYWPNLTTGPVNDLFWADRCKIPCPEFINWVIISEAKHVFLESVITQVVKNIQTYNPIRHGIAEQAVLGTTGPLVYTNAIFNKLSVGKFRMIEAHNEEIHYSIFPGMEHRKIIKSRYHGRVIPLVPRGLIIDLGVIFALVRMLLLRFRRKFLKFFTLFRGYAQ